MDEFGFSKAKSNELWQAEEAMTNLEDRITSLDVGLLDAVPSQTHPEDRESLLRLHRCVRRAGSYI